MKVLSGCFDFGYWGRRTTDNGLWAMNDERHEHKHYVMQTKPYSKNK